MIIFLTKIDSLFYIKKFNENFMFIDRIDEKFFLC